MKIVLNGKAEGLILAKAIRVLNRELSVDNLTGNERQDVFDEDPENLLLLEEGVYLLEEPVAITAGCVIRNTGAEIKLGSGGALHIHSGNVTLDGLVMLGGVIAVCIDGKGGSISDICIRNCRLDGFTACGVLCGSSRSHSRIERVAIENNDMHCGLMPGEDDIWGSATGISLFAATATSLEAIEDAILSDVSAIGNHIHGVSRCSITGMIGADMTGTNKAAFRNCHIRKMLIYDNNVSGSADTAMCVQTDYFNYLNCTFEDAAFIHNHIQFGIYGISISAGCPMEGISENVWAKNIRVIGNTLIGREGGCGEPNYAVFVCAGVMFGMVAQVLNSSIENVQLEENTIQRCERGIIITAGQGIVDCDAPSAMCGNVIRQVSVRDNLLRDVNCCFIFAGAWLEGRRYDWNFSYRHDQKRWFDYITDHRQRTILARDNAVENLTCTGNVCDGFRYFLWAAGAIGRGHAYMAGNRLCDGIDIHGNLLKDGEYHAIIDDSHFEDWVSGEGNQVAPDLKYSGFGRSSVE